MDSLYINRPYLASPLAFPNDDIEFIVEVTDSNGCIGYDSVKVFIFLANTSNDTTNQDRNYLKFTPTQRGVFYFIRRTSNANGGLVKPFKVTIHSNQYRYGAFSTNSGMALSSPINVFFTNPFFTKHPTNKPISAKI